MAALQYDSSRVGLSMNLLVFVHPHTKADWSKVLIFLVKHENLPYVLF